MQTEQTQAGAVQATTANGFRTESMVLEKVRATGAITGLLFELSVEQHYANPTDSNIEAIYTFPLPWGAVLLGMECTLGGKTLRGQVVGKAQAEAEYEDAIDNGDTAVMLERSADGLYTVNLGNLMGGENAIVRYRYGQLLRFEHGRIRLCVPTVIATRYGNAQHAGMQPHQVPAEDFLAEYPFDITIQLRGEITGGEISSPSHPVTILKNGDGAMVTLARQAWLDRDFILSIDHLAGKPLTAVSRDGKGCVVLASFCPAIPQMQEPASLACKILVDCSGSMAGDSMRSARWALHEVLKHFGPNDRFSFSAFGNDVQHLTSGLVKVTDATIRHAAALVAGLDADMGGTEIALALQSTWTFGGEQAADVLLITDGEVWETAALIKKAREAQQRVFAVGVGSAPAESLLRSLAEETGGACEFVAPEEDVEGAIIRTFLRMRQAQPIDVTASWSCAPLWQARPIGSRFGDETIHLFAGFAGVPPQEVALAMLVPNEQALQVTIGVHTALLEDDTLARLAGAVRLKDVPQAEQKALALHYQLVTHHTNLLIVHQRPEALGATSLPDMRRVQQMHAAGSAGAGTAGCGGALHRGGGFGPALRSRESAFRRGGVVMAGTGCYNIPAFLRKTTSSQPDSFRSVSPVPQPAHRQVRAIDAPTPYRQVMATFLQALDGWSVKELVGYKTLPRTFDDLATRLPLAVIQSLRALRNEQHAEEDIVLAFLASLIPLGEQIGVSRHLLRSLRHACKNTPQSGTLSDSIKVLLTA